MEYTRNVLRIAFLTVIYGSGILKINGVSPELLFVFSGVYAAKCEDFIRAAVTSVLCGVLMSGFCGRGFEFCVIMCLCFSLVCFEIKNTEHLILRITGITALSTFLFESVFYMIFFFKKMPIEFAALNVILPEIVYNSGVCPVIFGFTSEKHLRRKSKLF